MGVIQTRFWSHATAFHLAETWTGDEVVIVQLHDGHPGVDGTAHRIEDPALYVENVPKPIVWVAKDDLIEVPAVRKPWWAPWRWAPAHTVRDQGEIRATHASVWLDGEPILLIDFGHPASTIGGKFTIIMPPKLVEFDLTAPPVT